MLEFLGLIWAFITEALKVLQLTAIFGLFALIIAGTLEYMYLAISVGIEARLNKPQPLPGKHSSSHSGSNIAVPTLDVAAKTPKD